MFDDEIAKKEAELAALKKKKIVTEGSSDSESKRIRQKELSVSGITEITRVHLCAFCGAVKRLDQGVTE